MSDLIELKCNNCGGNLKFDSGAEFGFCMYCGTKVMIPKQVPEKVAVFSDTTRFFLLIYNKGEQTQHAIKDQVRFDIAYRDNATSSDLSPLGMEISSNGVKIPNKMKLGNTGLGFVEISGVGSNLTLTKEQKVKVGINGIEMATNTSSISYGDLVSIDKIILRIQPMCESQ